MEQVNHLIDSLRKKSWMAGQGNHSKTPRNKLEMDWARRNQAAHHNKIHSNQLLANITGGTRYK